MDFSIKRTLLFAPVHFTELAIYGRNGIDVRSRLLLWDALHQKRLTEHQLKDAMLQVLPLDFGERFLVAAGIATLVLGVLFIWLATDPVRNFILQIHRLTDGPVDYALLAVQWLAFYFIMSAVASCLTSIVAFNAYASRIAKHV